MAANGQPRALFPAESNFVFANELPDVFEADRRLMNRLAMRSCDRVNHLCGRHAARCGQFPLARFDQVVVDERKNQIRLDPGAVAIHDAKPVCVAVGCQSRSSLRIGHDFAQRREIFFGDVRPRAVEQTIAIRSKCRHAYAVIAERAVEITGAASVECVHHKLYVCFFQRFEAHEFLESLQIVLAQVHFFARLHFGRAMRQRWDAAFRRNLGRASLDIFGDLR